MSLSGGALEFMVPVFSSVVDLAMFLGSSLSFVSAWSA